MELQKCENGKWIVQKWEMNCWNVEKLNIEKWAYGMENDLCKMEMKNEKRKMNNEIWK